MAETIIVTRAEPGASETVSRLTALGLRSAKMPALVIEAAPASAFAAPELGDVYIFTSANGVRATLEAGWPTDHRAVCVGPATLAAAEAGGFKELDHADGNADDVFALICDQFSAEDGPEFVHVANADAAGDLVARLQGRGYHARFVPLYRAVPQSWAEVAGHWQSDVYETPVFLLHSARAAEVVKCWIEDGQIDPRSIGLVAMSARALAPLQAFSVGGTAIAARPNETEIMKALQSLLEQGVSSR